MNQEPIQPPSFLTKKILFGENVICHCKAHKGLWGIPLMFTIVGVLFICSFVTRDVQTLVTVGIVSFFMFLLFLLGYTVYSQTDIVLTNKRIITRQFTSPRFLNLEDARMIKTEDAMDKMDDANYHKRRRELPYYAFSFFLDMVSVSIIDKNASVFEEIHFVWALDAKELKKLFTEEYEKQLNNPF